MTTKSHSRQIELVLNETMTGAIKNYEKERRRRRKSSRSLKKKDERKEKITQYYAVVRSSDCTV